MMRYFPIIKTIPAELTGTDKLSDDVKDLITPIFELTKSRKTALMPEGDISKSYGNMLAAFPNRDFVLDVAPHEDLQNSELETFFDPSNGYQNWCEFIARLGNRNVIPTVQIDVDEGLDGITAQVKRLTRSNSGGRVAFRVPLLDPDTGVMLESITAAMPRGRNLIIIFDCGYIKPFFAQPFSDEVVRQQELCARIAPEAEIVIASSSFPRTVTMAGYGDDEFGEFKLEEVRLHNILIGKSAQWHYGDYATIHPFRYPSRGGTFVPRIDVPLAGSLFYYRYRRKDGGYVKAAENVTKSPLYKPAKCWGRDQIDQAAAKKPSGLSPSFWISVRVNIHITTQAKRIQKYNLSEGIFA